MADAMELLRGASTDIEGQILLTFLLALVLVAGGWTARTIRRRVDPGGHAARLLNVGLAGAFVTLAIGAAVALVWVWEGSATVDAVLTGLDVDNPLALATRIAVTLLLLVGSYLLSGVIKRIVFDFTRDRPAVTQHQTELAFRTTQLGVYVLVVIVVLGVWRVDLGGLLVGAGFLGIVVGLAARQTLGSLIAGFVLMFARPFEIGDWVQIGDREGIVTEISIVNTRVETFDGEFAMIPNDVVGATEVINRTRKGRLRIQVDVGVDYETDLERAIDVAEGAMGEVDDVLAVPQPRAMLAEFGASSIVLNLRFWIDKPSARRKWRAQTAVVAGVKAAFDDAGIKIPFPQRELGSRPGAGLARIDSRPEVVGDGEGEAPDE